MSDTPNKNQVNTTTEAVQAVQNRITKLNDTVDLQVEKIINDLDSANSELDGLIAIMTDRFIASTDPAHAITLARFFEMKLELQKKKIDAIKGLITDKGNELSSKKRSQGDLSLSDILSGAVLGATLGGALTSKHQSSLDSITRPVQIIDVDASHEFDTEDTTAKKPIGADDILKELLDD